MTLYLDITRILFTSHQKTPTGIERVEYAYAKAALERFEDNDILPIVTLPFATRQVSIAMLKRIVAVMDAQWGKGPNLREDPVYQSVRSALREPLDPDRPTPTRFGEGQSSLSKTSQIKSFLKLIADKPLTGAAPRSRNGPKGIYFNASHTFLERPQRFRWLDRIALPTALFIHDLIPSDYPEFVRPNGANEHDARIKTAGHLASHYFVNSDYTRECLETHLDRLNAPIAPIDVVPLGVEDSFLAKRQSTVRPRHHPYFLTIGTIEPRKNLIFLFNVWRRLHAMLGNQTPRLIIAGKRGWENENILDILDRSRELAPYLIEARSLSDAGLISLLQNSNGFLSPSHVEGFGMPVSEALTLGVPTIASDIPSYRQVGQDCAELIDPVDGLGWTEAIAALCKVDGRARKLLLDRANRFEPMTWANHSQQVMDRLKELQKK